jgi:uncharacterized tellurite resistance protein B-like protein
MALGDLEKQRTEIERIKSIIKQNLQWTASADSDLVAQALNEVAAEFSVSRKL